MHKPINKLLLIVSLAFVIPSHADNTKLADAKVNDTNFYDDTVASGILFKIYSLLGGHGTWSNLNANTTERFKGAMELIAKDSALFSDTKRGISLKKQGDELISFVSKAYIFASTPTDKLESKADADKFFKDLGFEPGLVNPNKLADMMGKKLSDYAKLTNNANWTITK